MKRRFLVLFMTLAAAAILSSTVLAAPNGKRVTFLYDEYMRDGIVLVFETSGLTKADLKDASVYVVSNWQKMYCKFADGKTIVRCSFPKKFAGRGSYRAMLAGFVFWGELPEKRNFTEVAGPAGPPADICPGQTAIYHLDATCSHNIHVTYNIFVSPGNNLANVVQAEVNLWAAFSDPITVNSVTFVGCQP
jgi:hypothetical protein